MLLSNTILQELFDLVARPGRFKLPTIWFQVRDSKTHFIY